MYYFLILLGCLSMVSCNGNARGPEVVEGTPIPAGRPGVRLPVPESKALLEAGPKNKVESPDRAAGHSFQIADHSAWNSLLERYVDSSGNVDYKSFSGNRGGLDAYLEDLAGKEPPESAGKNEKLAYYINLYNAATVQLILDNYPLKSIQDINSPWDTKRVKIGGRMVSLGDIEHKILRKMDEPRIHFAINCASFSCPRLMNWAFTPGQMESQLQEATTGFIRDTAKNRISKSSLQLSTIFDWYKMDFTENGTLIEYLNRFTENPISPDAKITYLEYDWSLNDAK